MVTRFRALSWMNRRHRAPMRAILGAVGYVSVLAATGRRRLASEAAELFRQDRIGLGAHRVRWYLCHGWTTPVMGRTPLFDPTTGMDAATVDALSRWLGRDSMRDRLARLYVLARQVGTSADQNARLDEFERVATTLVPALPTGGTAKDSPTAARLSLTDATAALRALKAVPIPWYIISGTFLGAVREGTFLRHDYDIDIGIHAEDFDEAVFLDAVSRADDLVLVNASPHIHMTKIDDRWREKPRPALYRVLHRSGIEIDAFIHYLEDGIRWHGSAKHRWDNTAFSLADIEIAGLTVQGPADAESYLTENYGSTWRVPVTSFDCSTGTPNVGFPHNLAAVAENLRIAVLSPSSARAEVARAVLTREGYVRGDTFIVPWR